MASYGRIWTLPPDRGRSPSAACRPAGADCKKSVLLCLATRCEPGRFAVRQGQCQDAPYLGRAWPAVAPSAPVLKELISVRRTHRKSTPPATSTRTTEPGLPGEEIFDLQRISERWPPRESS